MMSKNSSKFLISSNPNISLDNSFNEYFFSRFKIFTKNCNKFYYDETILIIIDGYVLPRYSSYDKYKNLSEIELVKLLFEQFQENITKYLKGTFSLVIISNKLSLAINDIHSIRKLYVIEKSDFYISNCYTEISRFSNHSINNKIFAIQALYQHLINGETIFADIKTTPPATLITIDKKIYIKQYFTFLNLVNLSNQSLSLDNFKDSFKSIILQYYSYFKPNSVLLTLTGGRDTRTILSALLSNSIKPTTFTFGLPDGTDVYTSRFIASKLDLVHFNPYIKNIDSTKYREYVELIFDYMNPHIHLHRAHRLSAIIDVMNEINDVNMLFLGAMGGDYIKGVSFNDYIMTEYLRKRFHNNVDDVKLKKEILDNNFVKHNSNIIEELIEFEKKCSYLNLKDFKNTELGLAYEIIGSLHDPQDINIFEKYVDNVVVPFMDIDVLESLFSTRYSLIYNYRTSKNLIKKIKGGELQCQLIRDYYPKLSELPFANGYTPNDLLGNRLNYIMKRIALKVFKPKSKPTFVYGDWFVPYVNDELNVLNENISQYYDLNGLKNGLCQKYMPTEGLWHKYTNPIYFSKFYNKLSI